METLVDTSVLVAAFNEDDSLHKKALKVMDECPKPFILHEYVINEAATVLMNKVGKEAANSFLLNSFTNSSAKLLHSTIPSFFSIAATFMASTTKQLSFTDAMLLALSKKYIVLTFDEALSKAISKKKQA